jgi:hypothetical protein
MRSGVGIGSGGKFLQDQSATTQNAKARTHLRANPGIWKRRITSLQYILNFVAIFNESSCAKRTFVRGPFGPNLVEFIDVSAFCVVCNFVGGSVYYVGTCCGVLKFGGTHQWAQAHFLVAPEFYPL